MKPCTKSSLPLNLCGIFVSAFMFSSKSICDNSHSLLASPVSCRTLPLTQYTIPPNPWIEIINQYVLASFFNLHLFQCTLPETPIGGVGRQPYHFYVHEHITTSFSVESLPIPFVITSFQHDHLRRYLFKQLSLGVCFSEGESYYWMESTEDGNLCAKKTSVSFLYITLCYYMCAYSCQVMVVPTRNAILHNTC